MAVVRQQVTADELLHMPDDGFRYELVQGELRQMNPAGNVHGRVTMSFAWRLARYVEINPRQRSATVYKSPTDIIALAEADVLNGGDVVPGFELAVREIFE
jgi:Uma2 family endonuclease